jgi:hypothetical protein
MDIPISRSGLGLLMSQCLGMPVDKQSRVTQFVVFKEQTAISVLL